MKTYSHNDTCAKCSSAFTTWCVVGKTQFATIRSALTAANGNKKLALLILYNFCIWVDV